MLKKRLIGVVTVKDGWAVQSFGFDRYLPLGKPECLVENLDRWGADEILVQVIDRSINGAGPDFDLLERIARLGLETPLIYGGGIRSIDEGVRVIQLGADRLVLDALFHDDPGLVCGFAERLGAQAIIVALPLSYRDEDVQWLNYQTGRSRVLSRDDLGLIEQGAVSEVLLIDWQHEGQKSAFDMRLAGKFPLQSVPVIVFGGISSPVQMAELLQMEQVTAVAVGNFLAYREHAIQKLKDALAVMPIRPAVYESRHSGLANESY